MKAHIVGIPAPFKCECGEQFILAKWEKDTYGLMHITMLFSDGEFRVCPFCGGKDGVRREEIVP